ncbi:TetR family transcriptional regulator [Brevibacterium sp. 'Marine']|uniref:TetR/AcrR family transcriptional regulator n=1 Tax=Brevibacterium sp. 'Marine' TaxID=2725563 RepID=UPI00145E8D7A|nr:TetR family transcriptional regulator [Brevibacterium sp. 'Marine']
MSARSGAPNDPGRRERIIAAALELILDDGVARVSHRAVAARADVPLGSMTYHFASIDEVITEAFRRLVDRLSGRYRAGLHEAATTAEAREAVVEIICGDTFASPREMAGIFELYSYGRSSPDSAELAASWMGISAAALTEHFTPDAAHAVDALIEGWTIHHHLDGKAPERELVRAAVTALTSSALASSTPS